MNKLIVSLSLGIKIELKIVSHQFELLSNNYDGALSRKYLVVNCFR